MSVVLLVILICVAACTCALLFFVVRARNKRLLLSATRGTLSDAPGGIGISAVCSGVSSLDQVANLLSVEYARYEVVVVLDSLRHPAEFADLVARYRLIRVEWSPVEELPLRGVRGLGRSRKRCYRRLVLVDREWGDAAGDFDAGASVATYDYLMPVMGGQYLLPGAVERLVLELGECPSGTIDLIRSCIGESMQLIAREAVVGAGGFAARPERLVPCEKRRMLWEPLFGISGQRFRVPRFLWMFLALLLLAAIVTAAVMGWWRTAAVLLTAVLVWAAAAYAERAFADMTGPGAGAFFSWRRCLGRLRMKNFTIS